MLGRRKIPPAIIPAKKNIGEAGLMRAGMGNWQAFHYSGLSLEMLFSACDDWARQLEGVDKPWLVWNAHHDWAVVQQKLVRDIGWTPVVGFDPRIGPPPLLRESVLIDFNAKMQLPVMWPHFPLEFAFRFCDRIAFWHSDLLIRPKQMAEYAERFADLSQGEIAATQTISPLKRLLGAKPIRYWELLGCTTRAASADQYENGCGWWCFIRDHENCTTEEEFDRRQYVFYDHGAGILYWEQRYGGKVIPLPAREIEEGHFSRSSWSKKFSRSSPVDQRRFLQKDLDGNLHVNEACRLMGIDLDSSLEPSSAADVA